MRIAEPGHFLGSARHRVAARSWSVADLRHRQPNRFLPHSHRWASLTFHLAGAYREDIAGSWIDRLPGTVVLRPPLAPHRDEIGRPGAWMLVVEVDPALFAERTSRATCEAWHPVRNPELVRLGWQLARELEEIGPGDNEVVDSYIEAMLSETTAGGDSRHRPPWLAKAVVMLQDCPTERLTVAMLAVECGVHPGHFARVFRRYQGMTVGAFARSVRVSHALSMLTRPGVQVAQAAHAAGFHDQSHFVRTLRRQFGLTPTQYRTVAASALGSAGPASGESRP